MNKLAVIFTTLSITLLATPIFAQGRVVDTVFVDSHKVTYVIDTSRAKPILTNGAIVPDSIAPEDSSGLHADPYYYNRFSADLIAQGLDFAITYERLFGSSLATALRLGYVYFDEGDIRETTDAEGTISAFTTPLMFRWYWGRRNTGKYYVVDADSQKYERRKNQIECFFQLSFNPVIYSVDIEYENDQGKYLLRDKEFGMPITIGIGTKMISNHFFMGTEINVGKYVVTPKFQNRIKVHEDHYDTRLLQKLVFESILSLGWIF